MKSFSIKNILILWLSCAFLFSNAEAQSTCANGKIFTEKKCAGDELSTAEMKLFQIINDYRRQNNLSPATISDGLSTLANRHLLDINANLKKTTHSWSNCNYDVNDKKTWECVSNAPKRLNVNYSGQGFENLYRNLNGDVEPFAALDAWKKSDLHNSLILNLNIWKDKNWDALGVAISGQYAAIWFGTKNSQVASSQLKPQGLGISLDEMVKNLNTDLAISRTSSVAEQSIWNGYSKDKTVALELIGKENDISKATITLKIKLGNKQKPSSEKRALMLSFIDNIFGKMSHSESWLDENVGKLSDKNQMTKSLIKDGKVVEIKKDGSNYLILTAKPSQKSALIEVF